MIALIQRVSEAKVVVDNKSVGEIQQGILAFIGVEKNDEDAQVSRLIDKVLAYRIFADENDKMNLNVRDIKGSLLLVPQFTLVADTQKGNRPSFSSAATPTKAEKLFNAFVEKIKNKYPHIQTGTFGADMKVSLLNDGPVTFWLQVN